MKNKEIKDTRSQKEILQDIMKVTSSCKLNASNRLRWENTIAFTTTTVLSLGLILIPLLQFAKIKLNFTSDELFSIQLFLAISILVYSIIINTSRYELRSELLNSCGNKIKKLVRNLRQVNNDDENEIKKINEEYSELISYSERHDKIDYLVTQLRENSIYKFTYFERIKLCTQLWLITLGSTKMGKK